MDLHQKHHLSIPNTFSAAPINKEWLKTTSVFPVPTLKMYDVTIACCVAVKKKRMSYVLYGKISVWTKLFVSPQSSYVGA